jgi:tetratricopeptide (TPR) repeat protein
MKQPPDSKPATESLYALLVKAGLTEPDAVTFINHLRKELISGSLADQEAIWQFIDIEITESLKNAEPERKQLAHKLKKAVYDVFIGVSGAAIWEELIKPMWQEISKSLATGNKKTEQQKTVVPEDWERGEIIIEWWIRKPRDIIGLDIRQQEPALRHVLESRETKYGLSDVRTAFFLDALGMCLDDQGRHREAARLRSTALKIIEIIYGQYHKRTAVALSNLSISLAAQGRYRQAMQYANKALKIVRWTYRDNSVPVACITLNLYEMLKAQGRLSPDAFSFLIGDKQMVELARAMTAYKAVFILLEALADLLEQKRKELEKADR